MERNVNSNLADAKRAKNDEFYTQYHDIEREMQAYLEYNPDVFRNKVVLLPCDDPEWSNFTKYFAQNFETFGLKKLISTSYAPDSKPIPNDTIPFLADLFDGTSNDEKATSHGRIFTLTRDVDASGRIDIDDLEWEYLEGDGDFRSAEVTALRDEADIVITNPPFSIFREFLAWLVEGGVQFSMIGNMNAITYKEVFPLIKDNKIWSGAMSMGTDILFDVPQGMKNDLMDKRLGSAYRIMDGKLKARASGMWFTNIEHGRRHDPLQLMTMEDNRRFNKKVVKGTKPCYEPYDNYDIIEVSFTDAIPSDYDGVMGVPISFLDKYSPDQFEILGIANSARFIGEECLTIINGVRIYNRILIRHLNPDTSSN